MLAEVGTEISAFDEAVTAANGALPPAARKRAEDFTSSDADTISIKLRDPDKSLARLLAYIKDTSGIGHSFNVVVDPGDPDYEKSFGIDGDGSFQMFEIEASAPTKTRGEDAYALDRETVRTTDGDGHLHVASSVVSAAQVNDYMAEEIPGWEALGLVKGRIYALLRDPVELEKAAATWHGKPLLIVHRGQTADDHDREITVGSVSNPVWEFPNLKAELTVWDGEAVAGIKNGTMKDLSSGYRYRPVMEPGEFQGVHYDGRMVELAANHVTLCKQGRVVGAFVGDSMDNFLWGKLEQALGTKNPWDVVEKSFQFFLLKTSSNRL
jgi:hypothetical protein